MKNIVIALVLLLPCVAAHAGNMEASVEGQKENFDTRKIESSALAREGGKSSALSSIGISGKKKTALTSALDLPSKTAGTVGKLAVQKSGKMPLKQRIAQHFYKNGHQYAIGAIAALTIGAAILGACGMTMLLGPAAAADCGAVALKTMMGQILYGGIAGVLGLAASTWIVGDVYQYTQKVLYPIAFPN